MSETISLCIEEFYLALHESEVRNRQTKSRRNSGEQPVRVS